MSKIQIILQLQNIFYKILKLFFNKRKSPENSELKNVIKTNSMKLFNCQTKIQYEYSHHIFYHNLSREGKNAWLFLPSFL